MKRLVLTTSDSGAGGIGAAGLADFVVTLGRRLVWGPPPSRVQLETFFIRRETQEERGAFDYWETGELLDGLAHCPVPAVAGLDEGPFTMELHDDRERRRRYFQSKLSLTPLGKAILEGKEDVSHHNPIHRWWGGTELTNDRLWRWDLPGRMLVAP